MITLSNIPYKFDAYGSYIISTMDVPFNGDNVIIEVRANTDYIQCKLVRDIYWQSCIGDHYEVDNTHKWAPLPTITHTADQLKDMCIEVCSKEDTDTLSNDLYVMLLIKDIGWVSGTYDTDYSDWWCMDNMNVGHDRIEGGCLL